MIDNWREKPQNANSGISEIRIQWNAENNKEKQFWYTSPISLAELAIFERDPLSQHRN